MKLESKSGVISALLIGAGSKGVTIKRAKQVINVCTQTIGVEWLSLDVPNGEARHILCSFFVPAGFHKNAV